MTIHLYGSLARTVSPGDVVDVSGIFLPTPYTGIRALRAGLLQDTYLEAQHVKQMKKGYNEMEMTDKIREDLEELRSEDNIYSKLAMRSVTLEPRLFPLTRHRADPFARFTSGPLAASHPRFTDTRTSRRRFFFC